MFSIDILGVQDKVEQCKNMIASVNYICDGMEDSEVRALSMVNAGRRYRRVFVASQELTSEIPNALTPLTDLIRDLESLTRMVTGVNDDVAQLVNDTKIEELGII